MANAFTNIAKRLHGKSALITGGASGIGKCTAEYFAQNGAKVVIADIQDELGLSVQESIGQSDCTYIHCDATKEEDIKNAVNKTVEVYGKLDIMFNNAAISDNNKPSIIHNEVLDFEKVLKTNVTGTFLGMKHAARVMVPNKSGCIISMSSIASKLGGASTHAYCSSKHAILGLTRNLAVELGQFGIRVNCISPYGVATPFSKKVLGLEDEEVEVMMEKLGNLKGTRLKADDVAHAAVYLASDEANYVSGHNLFIDGGFSVYNSAFLIGKSCYE